MEHNQELQQKLNELGQGRDVLERLATAIEQQNALAAQQMEVIEALREALREKRSQPPPVQVVDPVVPLSKAAPLLGYEDNRNGQQQLWRQVGENLRIGVEVEDRRSLGSQRPQYWFRIEACRKRFAQPPGKRGAA